MPTRSTIARGAVVGTLLAASVVAPVASAGPASVAVGCDVSSPTPGGAWPTMGRGLAQDNHQRDEKTLGAATIGQVRLKWSTQAPVNPGQGTPVVAGDCVYVTGSGRVFALDAVTGKSVWSTVRPVTYLGDGAAAYPPQGVSVMNGRVHVGVDNGNKPVGMALDARTGKHLWTSAPVLFGYRATQLSVPKAFDGIHLLFTTGPDWNPHARPGFAFLDERTGRVLTKRTTLPAALSAQGYSGGGIWATAAIDTRGKYAYVGTSNPYTKTRESEYDNAIVKIDMNRKRRTFGQVVAVTKGTPDAANPALYMSPMCQQAGESMPGSPGFQCGQDDADFGIGPTLFRNRAGRLMLAEMQKNGHFHILDATTMTRTHDLLLGPNANTSLLTGNAGMAAWDGTRLYVSAFPGTLYAVDPDTGLIAWAVPGQDSATPGRAVVVANGLVYTVNTRAMVVAHDAATGAPVGTPLDPGRDTGQPCDSEPHLGLVIAHHTIFVNCGAYLAAYGL